MSLSAAIDAKILDPRVTTGEQFLRLQHCRTVLEPATTKLLGTKDPRSVLEMVRDGSLDLVEVKYKGYYFIFLFIVFYFIFYTLYIIIM